MQGPDIQKLRRFALGFGLILVTYSLAGVQLDTPAKLSPLGIPLVLQRPDLVGWGLALASVYGAFRYWYYGILLSLSPRRGRKLMLAGKIIGEKSRLLTAPTDAPIIGKLVESEIDQYFPHLPFSDGVEFVVVSARGEMKININRPIPKHVRLLAMLQDIDYYAPVWVNVLAILAFAFTTIY